MACLDELLETARVSLDATNTTELVCLGSLTAVNLRKLVCRAQDSRDR